ncbi:putative gtp binding protein bms1 [Diaporthe ampelina]|uniref:Putative gtp binding protein bms1 n=1 Tax=Diaporthe ampelina TaxID=1214573 RepID=A0A0G2FPW2_9PEZI|nr:putative gtp binding protein bms1 [Diaporthe ampelina]
MEAQSNKPHRKPKEKKKHTGDNPKAFAVHRPGKLQAQAARSQDIKEKRLHVPLVDRFPDEPPPRLVAIVGPPGVGKTTLLKSLIRRYSKETISNPQGPITVVTSKKQRLTFIECPNELEAMVDIAKVADIVLLMIDGNFGFEMETMEFLNVLAATGMPGNVFGILTHLDLFKKPHTLRDAKKRLKHRLWSELYQGAHLFYLSGVINGRYPDREVHNLSRFLSIMKNPRPLIWRNSHPYTIIDSWRDITHPTKIEENEKCDRSIVLSGYLRGTNFASQGQRVHIPGLGDYTLADVEVLPDPCPTPAMEQALAKITGKTGRRRLDDKDKKLYAPMSDRSGLQVDGDTIYIYRDKGFTFDKDAKDVERGEGEELIINLQSERRLLGQTEDGVQLFAGGEELKEARDDDTGRKSHRQARIAEQAEADAEDDLRDDDDESDLDADASDVETEFNEKKLGKMFRNDAEKDGDHDDVAFADSDSDLGSISGEEGTDEEDSSVGEDFDSGDEDAALQWKENMEERAKQRHGKKAPFQAADLARMLYNDSLGIPDILRRWRGDSEEDDKEDIEEDSGDETFFKKSKNEKEDLADDRSIPTFDYDRLASYWSNEESIEALRQKFTTATLLHDDDGEDGDGDDDFDGFGSGDEQGEGDDDDGGEGDGAFEDLETGEKHGPIETDLEAEREKNARRKEELKLRFEEEDREGFNNDKANARREGGGEDEFGEDDWYDTQKAMIQKQLDINKAEFENLDERQRSLVEGHKAGKYAKLVIEGVPAEFVKQFNAKMPIIVGGLSATEDRMLKYTPEHMHCFATFYGPLIAPNTGFVSFNSFSNSNPGFRIAATGTILSVDESTEIVKKLKLTGTPYKIFKNTAFIKDMFNTSLEIAKFEGASIKTVSGIRGQIKRALSKPEGHFRATFEDKILLSDIVFLRAWYPIKPHRFYNPVTNLVGWQRARLTGEIRAEQALPTPQNKDSQYRRIERTERHFNPLRVPRKLAADLPYKSQIVQTKAQKKPTYMQKRAVVLGGEEKKARDLMQKLTTIRKDVAEKRKAKKDENRAAFKKKMADMAEKKAAREKRETKEWWSREGKKRRSGDEGGGGGKRRK